MKTTTKVTAIASILTLGLAASSFATPVCKVTYTPREGPVMNASGMGASHVWFMHPRPASQL